MRSHSNASTRQNWLLGLGLLCVAAAGCSKDITGVPFANERPTVQLTARPQPQDSVYYSVRLQWTSSDSDGQVTHFLYAIDPQPDQDTAWVRTERSEVSLFFQSTTPNDPLPPQGAPIPSSDYHTFVLKAVDDLGMASPFEAISFTSYTVAPFTRFLSPTPTDATVNTAPTVLIRWNGEDPDGERSQKPVLYKVKLVSEATIKAFTGNSTTPSNAEIQRFFEQEAPDFASWEPRPPDSTFRQVEGLTTQQIWFFAIVAFDEAGAYEPRFARGTNVLQFRPITTLLPPRLSIGNSFFFYEQSVGGVDLRESKVFPLEVPSGQPIDLHWSAVNGAEGTEVVGYRWVLDPLGGDIFDETPRDTDEQTYRWSSWSITELETVIGPFSAPPGADVRHRFFVEARDNVGLLTLVTIELRVVTPTFANEILFVDDYDGGTDRVDGQPYGTFPTEAVLDTLLYAIGGYQHQFRPDGTLSLSGVFAGFPGDTLDYRHFPFNGIPLRTLGEYKNVVWYTGRNDAGNKNEKFKANSAIMAALRMHNTPGNLNTPSVFLTQGGRMFFFGDGVCQAIANGYIARFRQVQASFPYRHTGDMASAGSILWPGNFLYDFFHLRSEMNHPSTISSAFRLPETVVDLVPYLPEFQTPGAPWPYTGWMGTRGPMDDPRVGPSSSRHVMRWQGLPMLTLTREFNNWPNGAYPLSSIENVPFVSQPNFILEDFDPGPLQVLQPTLDTLYIARAVAYDLNRAGSNTDGKPVMFYYHGQEHGEIGWTGIPLWEFDRTQARQFADVLMRNWGYTRMPGVGLGTVHTKAGWVTEDMLVP